MWNTNTAPSLVKSSKLFNTVPVKSAVKIPPCSTDVRPKNYKQQRRTPLLFLTGKSPEVIFPLPWNKSMKHNSLWTIAHLLKSDVGWGASHHHAYSVCWQRRPLINKACSLKQVPEHEFSFERQFRKLTDERECLLVCTQPFGFCVSFPKSQRCFWCKQWCCLHFN